MVRDNSSSNTGDRRDDFGTRHFHANVHFGNSLFRGIDFGASYEHQPRQNEEDIQEEVEALHHVAGDDGKKALLLVSLENGGLDLCKVVGHLAQACNSFLPWTKQALLWTKLGKLK